MPDTIKAEVTVTLVIRENETQEEAEKRLETLLSYALSNYADHHLEYSINEIYIPEK